MAVNIFSDETHMQSTHAMVDPFELQSYHAWTMSQILTEQSAAVVASWLSVNQETPTTLLRRCAPKVDTEQSLVYHSRK